MTDYLNREELREYDRQMFRSSLVTLFWRVISTRKKQPGGFKLQTLAEALSIGKSTVSRWFSPNLPNWEADTILDIASALNLDLHITAIDRTDGTIYSARGPISHANRVSISTTTNGATVGKSPTSSPENMAGYSVAINA